MVTVVVVPHLFQACRFEPVSLVNDQKLGKTAGAGLGVHKRVDDSMIGVVHRIKDLLARGGQPLVDLPDGGGDVGSVKRGPCFKDSLRTGATFSVRADCQASHSFTAA